MDARRAAPEVTSKENAEADRHERRRTGFSIDFEPGAYNNLACVEFALQRTRAVFGLIDGEYARDASQRLRDGTTELPGTTSNEVLQPRTERGRPATR